MDTTSATDRRTALSRACLRAAKVAGRVRPDQLALPTPCSDYDVTALVDHLVGAANRAVMLGRGETPGGEEFPHVELADAPGQLRRAAADAEAAWADDARLTAVTTMPWGETYTGATLVDMYLAEVATHAWDLAIATGQPLGEEDLAEVALEGARGMLRPEYRNQFAEGNPFGSEVAAPPDATPWERLAAFMGRAPR